MTEIWDKDNPELRTSRVYGIMIDHASSKLQARQLPPVMSDEKPSAGGKNRGPSPLELILMGLCA